MKFLDILASQLLRLLLFVARLPYGASPSGDTNISTTDSKLARSFAQVLGKPAPVVIPPADVRRVPRLTGAPDVDVPKILTQHRLVVGFLANTARPHGDDLGDALAHEHFMLICDGPCITLYQQLMSGQIYGPSDAYRQLLVMIHGRLPLPRHLDGLKVSNSTPSHARQQRAGLRVNARYLQASRT